MEAVEGNMAVGCVEWHWTGHHPLYFSLFVEALVKGGWRVVALCPEPELEESKWKSRWCGRPESGQVLFRRFGRTKRRFQARRPKYLFKKISELDWGMRHYLGANETVRQAAAEMGWTAEGLVFPCLYDFDFKGMEVLHQRGGLPWVGLLVHANGFRIPQEGHMESRFPGPSCRALGVLDEGIVREVETRHGKPAIALPDVADCSRPQDPGNRIIASRLRQFAFGRRIVGLFGHLVASKGVLQLIRISERTELAGVCFAFAGEPDYAQYSPDEVDTIRRAFTSRENIWAMPIRIPEEEQLNALIEASDVISVAYRDFPHSSNMLTKAASFRRPVIASEGYLLGERTRKHRLGELVDPEDDQSLVDAIVKLTRDPTAWIEANHPGWEEFSDLQSMEAWRKAVLKLAGHLTV